MVCRGETRFAGSQSGALAEAINDRHAQRSAARDGIKGKQRSEFEQRGPGRPATLREFVPGANALGIFADTVFHTFRNLLHALYAKVDQRIPNRPVARGVDAKARTVELSFSSETPVERGDYSEVLDHSTGSVDLSRLDGGPLLVDHDSRDQVGVIESAAIGADRKGRAKVRFGKSARAQEIFQDVADGIRKLVSVGYRITKSVVEDGKDGIQTLRATSWTPLEISLVSVPADMSVGVGRSVEMERSAHAGRIEVVMDSREHIRTEISCIADRLENKVPGIREMANRAILQGNSVEEFQRAAMAALPGTTPISVAPPLADIKPKEWERYSIGRAIRCQLQGHKLDGIEGEMHTELVRRTGTEVDNGGCWVPGQVFAKRNYVAGTNTLGGFVVSTPTDGSQFIELLRNRARVAQLGARILNLNTPIQIPRQSGAGTANWLNGETAASTLSAGNFTQITLTPKGCGALQQYSSQLLATSDPSIDALIRDDINKTLAILIDQAALHGSGSLGAPTGIANTTGIKTVALATDGQALGNSTALSALVSLETLIATDNADTENMAYLVNPNHRAALKTTVKFANTGFTVWEPENKLNGYRAEVSNQIATNLTTGTATTICSCIFFGNWNDVLIGEFNGGATSLIADPYTLAANGVVRLLSRRWVDIGLRHGSSMALLGGIR